MASDMSLFFRRESGKISGLLAFYMEDTLACGDNNFAELTKKTKEEFETKVRHNNNLGFLAYM